MRASFFIGPRCRDVFPRQVFFDVAKSFDVGIYAVYELIIKKNRIVYKFFTNINPAEKRLFWGAMIIKTSSKTYEV